MPDIKFKRTGDANKNGSVPGELQIGSKRWPTIERGKGYTFVRKGEYVVQMTWKVSGRTVRCLMFDHDYIRTHLIHDAKDDKHKNLSGCIAPGLKSNEEGIIDSAKAMEEIWDALGTFKEGSTKTIEVQNNINNEWRNDTKDEWIKRRQAQGKRK